MTTMTKKNENYNSESAKKKNRNDNAQEKTSSTNITDNKQLSNKKIIAKSVKDDNGGIVVDSDGDGISSLTEGLGSVTISSSRKDNLQRSDSIIVTKPQSSPLVQSQPIPEAIQQIATLLASFKYTNIVVLTGAGISVSAGIPDFRSPNTGLYDNLAKYNLPYPEAVFDLSYYKSNPGPFIQLACELWPGICHSPTITHSFIALLERKGVLLRNYTQNIDCLDVLAGVSEETMIECHGHFRTASCTKCHSPYDGNECKRTIVEQKTVPLCTRNDCGGYVKPDIVFFGEDLPPKFHTCVKKDMQKADLLLVMGTSLMVSPVNMIPNMVSNKCIRILLNNECVGSFAKKHSLNNNRMTTRNSSSSSSHSSSSLTIAKSKSRDIFHPGDCDTSIRSLCNILGWTKELEELNQSTRLEIKKSC
jgi:NAD-dependent SIR2 family protein deacetylase